MSGRQDAGGDAALDQGRQLEQPQRVGDLRPGPSDPAGQLVVGAAEVLQQLVVGVGLLQRVELGAVQVLQQGVAQHDVVAARPHDRRQLGQTGLAGGPHPPLTHDQLVALTAERTHDHGLQQAHLADGVHQLGHRVLVEDLARLARVGLHRVEGDLGEVGAAHQLLAVRGGGGTPRVTRGAAVPPVSPVTCVPLASGVGGPRPPRDARGSGRRPARGRWAHRARRASGRSG